MVSFNAIGVIELLGRGLDSGAAGQDLDGRECRRRQRRAATIGSPPMVEHVSPEGFLGGVLFGALVVWLAAYLIWGKGRNATKVQLLAAQANEAAAQASERATLMEAAQDRAQDRAEYERKLAATRTAAEKDREQDRAEYEKELAATRTAAEKDREQDRAEYEKELAAIRTAAEKDREQDRAEYERGLSTAREGYHRARAEATWRSLSVGRTDWHDSLPSLTDGRLARKMD
jgi:flagellar biosynthesis GTPase FlhF